MRLAVKIAVWEYERGWGNKLDDWMVCLDIGDALKFKEEFNSRNTDDVAPDYYMQCEGEPLPIELDDEQYDRLKEGSYKGTRGRIWLYSLKNVKQ